MFRVWGTPPRRLVTPPSTEAMLSAEAIAGVSKICTRAH